MFRRTRDGSSRFCRNSPEFDGPVGQVEGIKSLCRESLPEKTCSASLDGITHLETAIRLRTKTR